MTRTAPVRCQLTRVLLVALLVFTVLAGVPSAPYAYAAADLQSVGYPADVELPADTPKLAYKYPTAQAGIGGTPEPIGSAITFIKPEDCYNGAVPRGTTNHLKACWVDYVRNRAGKSSWSAYRGRYIAVYNNRNRGDAFEKAVAKAVGAGTVDANGNLQLKEGWGHDKLLGGKYSEGGRRVDLFNLNKDDPARGLYEIKSGPKLDPAQLRDLAKIAFNEGVPLRYVFGTKPDQASLAAIAKINDEYKNNPDPAIRERYKSIYGNRGMAEASQQPSLQIPLPIDPKTGKPADCSAAGATPAAGGGTNCAPASVLPPELDESIGSPDQAAEYAGLDEDINDTFNRGDARASLTPTEYQPPAPPPFEPPAPPVQEPIQPPTYYPPSKPGYPTPPPIVPAKTPPYQPPPSRPIPYPAPKPYTPAPPAPNWPLDEPYSPPAQSVTYPYYPPVVYYNPPPQPPFIYPTPAPVYANPAPGQPPQPPYNPPPSPPWSPPAPPAQRIDIPQAAVQAPPPPQLQPAPPRMNDAPNYTPPDYGGVDFTSLQFNYVSDMGPGSAGYSFAANTAPPGGPAYGGADKAQMSIDALRAFLDLPVQSFWVNLQPGQADRIIDRDFGKTQAGQVMLEADLLLKGLAHRFEYEDAQGPREWVNALQGWIKGDSNNFRYGLCIPGARQWIDSGEPASVRTDGNQLYILKIPLTVHVDFEQKYACDQGDPAVNQNNQDAYMKYILPKIIDCVNTCPEFADLRRVYAARVAAEWFRQRNTNSPTAYADLIDKRDVELVRSRTPWDPFELFQRYMKDFRKTDYPGFGKDIPLPNGQTGTINMTLVGGVVFDKTPIAEVPADQFTKDYPSLAESVKAGQEAPHRDEAMGKLMIGDIAGAAPAGVPLTDTMQWRPWSEDSSPAPAGLLNSTATQVREAATRPAVYGGAGAVVAVLAGILLLRRKRKVSNADGKDAADEQD